MCLNESQTSKFENLPERLWTSVVWGAILGFAYFCFFDLPLPNRNGASLYDWYSQRAIAFRSNLLPAILLPIVVFFIWRRRGEIFPVHGRPSYFGVFLVAFAAAWFATGYRIENPYFIALSLPILLVGSGWLIDGRRAARALLFPAFLLLFFVPIPGYDRLANSLGLEVSGVTCSILGWLGVEVLSTGTGIMAVSGNWVFDPFEG